METNLREPRIADRIRSSGETEWKAAVHQALAQARAACPLLHERRGTSDARRTIPPCCGHCLYAGTMHDGDQEVPICANTPNAPGEIVRIAPAGACPNFRPKPEPIVHGVPPQPPDDTIRYIPLTKGKYAIVDAADYEWLSKYKWHIVSTGKQYAGRKQNGKTVYMHREIMQPLPGMVVDHIDGNGFNNRRGNMRNCTNQQNMQNLRKSPRAGSRYKGVSYDKRRQTFSAKICHNGRSHHLGAFATEVEAAKAYDRKALELFGEFARLNFPQEVERGSVEALKRRSGEEADQPVARPSLGVERRCASGLVARAGEAGGGTSDK